LVRACREAKITVSPVPGPSAVVTALCASGLPPHPFVFLGFPPRKTADQEDFFAPYATVSATLIFFERKDRIRTTLENACATLGPREVCIARELTKPYEEFIFLPLQDYVSVPDTLLGEITVLIGPPKTIWRENESVVLRWIQEERALGGKPREVARRVRRRVPGWTISEIYVLMQILVS
jgi:16S rRNA (cytidine1402-2'-O)-methyltransferase